MNDVVDHRRSRPLFIVDAAGGIVARSSTADAEAIACDLPALLLEHRHRARGDRSETTTPCGKGRILRIADLVGAFGSLFAVTHEETERRRDVVEIMAGQYGLTQREREVFEMLVAGKSHGEIADRLFIARTTASDHVKNILRKAACARRAELLARVIGYAAADRPPVKRSQDA